MNVILDHTYEIKVKLYVTMAFPCDTSRRSDCAKAARTSKCQAVPGGETPLWGCPELDLAGSDMLNFAV